MKKYYRKIAAVATTAGLIASLVMSGCGKKEDDTTTKTSTLDPNGESYVADFFDVTDANGKAAALSNIYQYGDRIYLSAYTNDDSNYQFLAYMNTDDMQIAGRVDYTDAINNAINKDELPDNIDDYDQGTMLNGIVFSEDGIRLFASWYAYDYSNIDPDDMYYTDAEDGESNSDSADDADIAEADISSIDKDFILDYDSNFNLISVNEITFDFIDSNDYIQDVADDGKGHLCFITSHGAVFTDAEFNVIQDVHVTDNWVSTYFFDGNGNLNLSYYTDSWDTEVAKVTADSPTAGEGIGVKDTYVTGYFASASNNNILYYYDDDKLYSMEVASGEKTELLKWVNIDVSGSSVRDMLEGADGSFYAVSTDYDTGISQVMKIYKKSNSEIVEKTEIRLGAVYNSDPTMEAAIVAYNKSQDKYRIVPEYYYDWENDSDSYEDSITDLNNSVLSGSAPDIICLEGLNVDAFVKKGVLEDIRGFIAGSDNVKLEDYNSKVIEAFTFDDKLVALSRSFNIMTVVVNANDFPEGKEGWTFGEMMEYLDAHPGSDLEAYILRGDFLENYVGYNLDEYIDWKNGTCDFNKDSFKKALEYAAKLSEEYDWANIDENFNIAEALSQGKVLSQRMIISDVTDVQMIDTYFALGAKYIGFPDVEGKSKHIMTTGTGYAISATSANKEAAWDFLEFYLNRERSNWDYSFPSKNSELQAMYDKELEHAGEPNGSAMVDDTGFEYEFHYSTQEEIDKINEIIGNAVAINVDSEIMSIISEEAGGYFSGQKSLDDVIGLIQSRVQIYVSERM